MFTPMPPSKTGVAHYASMLVPALAKRVELTVNPSVLSPQSSVLVYQLGNNPHHETIYAEAMRVPGVAVLHDLVLHHLIVEMTLARGDVDGYVAALKANHGEPGAAWARGRAAGLHGEIGNFLFPASIEVAQRSRAVIVHNRYAADRLRSFGVTTPIHVVPHPFEPSPQGRREEMRARHGFAADDRVVGFFGYLTSAKRAEVVLEAFADARAREPRLRLLVVGEPAPNVDVALFQSEGITFTGYVPDDEFAAYFAAVDRLVNLRYPTAGETSGTLIRAIEAGKPVAVSDYAQFAELPVDVATKIPLGAGEVGALVRFFVDDLPDNGAAQRAWLAEHANIEATVDGYLRAIESPERAAEAVHQTERTIALFPRIEATLANGAITLRNRGDFALRVHAYGEPAYRLIVKWDGGDTWIRLPGDLAPGAAVTIEAPAAGTLRLHHALESVPTIDPRPFAELSDAAAV